MIVIAHYTSMELSGGVIRTSKQERTRLRRWLKKHSTFYSNIGCGFGLQHHNDYIMIQNAINQIELNILECFQFQNVHLHTYIV